MRFLDVGLTLVAVVSVSLFAAELRSDWNVRDHIPLSQFVVQSHRGAGNLMAENSVAAFDLAWQLGTIPEADIRTTRDGVIVAFHDEDFTRILPNAEPEQQKRGIKDLTWEETARLDIGSWKGPGFADQRVPRMSEMCALLHGQPERRMYIDIKNVDLEQLATQTKNERVTRQLILASTDYAIIRRWKALAPESPTLYWMRGSDGELAGRFADLRKTDFADITQLQIHVHPKGSGITPSAGFLIEAGRELRAHGILFQAFAYDAAQPADFWRLLDLGVASFATDSPDLAMKAIREYYERRAERR
jgi:glycerophosphoryl diester phosphodiesterase